MSRLRCSLAGSIEKFNPMWKNRTGWELESRERQHALEPGLAAALRAAYLPFNRQLFTLLGRVFDW